MECRARTGITALADCEIRWKALRPLGVSVSANANASDTSHATFVQLPNDRLPYTHQEAVQAVKQKAVLYLNSNPGPDEAAKNHRLHSSIHKLLKGTQFSPEELGLIDAALDYRQWHIMAEANVLRDELGLQLHGDCEDFDPSVRNFPSGIFQCVVGHNLFRKPTEDEGWSYAKAMCT